MAARRRGGGTVGTVCDALPHLPSDVAVAAALDEETLVRVRRDADRQTAAARTAVAEAVAAGRHLDPDALAADAGLAVWQVRLLLSEVHRRRAAR